MVTDPCAALLICQQFDFLRSYKIRTDVLYLNCKLLNSQPTSQRPPHPLQHDVQLELRYHLLQLFNRTLRHRGSQLLKNMMGLVYVKSLFGVLLWNKLQKFQKQRKLEKGIINRITKTRIARNLESSCRTHLPAPQRYLCVYIAHCRDHPHTDSCISTADNFVSVPGLVSQVFVKALNCLLPFKSLQFLEISVLLSWKNISFQDPKPLKKVHQY